MNEKFYSVLGLVVSVVFSGLIGGVAGLVLSRDIDMTLKVYVCVSAIILGALCGYVGSQISRGEE